MYKPIPTYVQGKKKIPLTPVFCAVVVLSETELEAQRTGDCYLYTWTWALSF